MQYKNNIIVNVLLVLFSFQIVSCENRKEAHPNNVIPLASTVGNYQILNLTDFATDIRYIPLETNDSVLISSIILQIIYENEKILIFDAVPFSNKVNCYLFDKNGKYCRKIGHQGQGPNDYLNIENVSMHNNLIFLMDWKKILIYDINGHLIKSINMNSSETPDTYNNSMIRKIIPLKKDAFIVSVTTMKGYYPTAYLFETNQSEIVKIKEYPSSVILDKLRSHFDGMEAGCIYRFNNEVRVYKIINDTIFTIDQNTEIKDAFIFDFGEYGTTLSYLEGKEGTGDRSYSRKFISANDIYESFKHVFIKFNFGNHTPEPFETEHLGNKYISPYVYGVFDKFTGKLSLMRQPQKGKLGFKNDIDNGPIIFPKYISSNNELVTYIPVDEFLYYYEKIGKPTHQMTEIANKIKFDDNQIVIIAQLNE